MFPFENAMMSGPGREISLPRDKLPSKSGRSIVGKFMDREKRTPHERMNALYSLMDIPAYVDERKRRMRMIKEQKNRSVHTQEERWTVP